MAHSQWLPRRFVRALAAPLVMAGVLTGAGSSAASAACESWTGAQPPSPGTANQLNGVTVLSACDAWAVGFDSSGGPSQTLIEH